MFIDRDSTRPRLRQLRRLYRLLTSSERLKFLIALLLAVVAILLETVSLGAVFLVVGAIIGGDTSTSQTESIPFGLDFVASFGLVASMSFLVVVFAVKNLFTVSLTWFHQGLFNQLSTRLGHRLLGVYLNKPLELHLANSSPVLITKVQNANLVSSGLFSPLMTLVVDSFVGISMLGLLFVVEPFSTLLILSLFLGFGLLLLRSLRRHTADWGEEQVRWRTYALRVLQDAFGAFKEIRVMGRESSSILEYRHSLQQLARVNRLFLTSLSFPRMGLETLSVLTISILVVAQSIRGVDGEQTLPLLALFAAGALRMVPSANRMMTAIQQIRVTLPLLAGLIDDLEQSSSTSHTIANTTKVQTDSKRFEELSFESVCFRYSTSPRYAITNFDIRIRRGDAVGLIGPSGVGKTTLVDLALGLLEPTSGTICLNGQPLAQSKQFWRSTVGYVAQNVFLVDASIRQNVCLGLTQAEIDDEKVWAAIRTARLESFVQSLPLGLNSSVGELGMRISGGERQRIGIARALYSEPQVLFLDEATSALDGATESALLSEIQNLKSRVTIIFVTHRLTALRICDRVVELQSP